MVVDCGTLGDEKLLRPVVENIVAETEGKVSVVVASHRHVDHIRGFASCAALWNRVRVEEVWLPWTENPEDGEAMNVRSELDGLARRLTRQVDVEDAWQLAKNSITDEAAMDVLLYGFTGSPRRLFLSSNDGKMGSAALPGVQIHVAGPNRGPDSLSSLEVGATMANLTSEREDSEGRTAGPFGARWRIRDVTARRIFRASLRQRPVHKTAAHNSLEDLCHWLDGAINNTSLVLFLRCGGARLLLPGDAQGVAWVPTLVSPELSAELAKVKLYKVAHHGSHTGTPPRVLRGLKRPLSLLSTDPREFATIPSRDIYQHLAAHGRLARTDESPRGGKEFRQGPLFIESHIAC